MCSLVFARKILISLFLSLSIFIVASCFIRKANNKPLLTYDYVIGTIQNYDISFRFREHLKEYENNFSSMTPSQANSNFIIDTLTGIKSIAINVYNTFKLIILLVVDTLRVGIDIMLMVADFVGFID